MTLTDSFTEEARALRFAQLDAISQLAVIRLAESKLRKPGESLTAGVKQYMGLNELADLADHEQASQSVGCPVCQGEPLTLEGVPTATLKTVAGRRWVDWSALSDEEAIWAVRHGLAQLDTKALDGLEKLTDPLMIRFGSAVHSDESERLEIKGAELKRGEA